MNRKVYHARYMGIPCKFEISQRELWSDDWLLDKIIMVLAHIEMLFAELAERLGFEPNGLKIYIYDEVKEDGDEKGTLL